MRLIDADVFRKVLELMLPEYHGDDDEVNTAGTTIYQCIATLDDAPTIDPENLRPQWISATERLPKTSEQYLVTVAEVRWPKSTYDSIDSPTERTFVCAMYFDYVNKLWHKDDGFVLNALVNPDDILDGYFAVAWMPLPEPYNPEMEDNNDQIQ